MGNSSNPDTSASFEDFQLKHEAEKRFWGIIQNFGLALRWSFGQARVQLFLRCYLYKYESGCESEEIFLLRAQSLLRSLLSRLTSFSLVFSISQIFQTTLIKSMDFQNWILVNKMEKFTFSKEIATELKIRGLSNFESGRTNLTSVFQQNFIFMVIHQPKNSRRLKLLNHQVQKPKLRKVL
jgi:hypothetical protein